jgi:asparagine synthase (glutamine-hydrolysing)
LEGQGADELFAGYHGYQNFRIMSLVEKRDFLQLFNYVCHWVSVPGRPVKNSILYLIYELLPRELKAYVKEKIKPKKEYSWLDSTHVTSHQKQSDIPKRSLEFWGSRVIEELREQLTLRGLPALLRHSDRSSMHFSIESRVPFLTTKIANYSMSLPENYHVPNTGVSKSLLRESMKGLVPFEVLYRKDKIGFETPENDLVNSSILIEAIKGHRFSDASILKEKLLIAEFTNQKKLSVAETRQIWRVFNLIRWAELHDIEI